MAFDVIATIDLDMTRPNVNVVNAVQYDSSGRVVKANLFNNGQEWAIPSNCYPVIRYRKSDRMGGFYDTDENGAYAISIENGRKTINITLALQALTTAGNVDVQINFYNSARQRVTTFAFRLRVQASAVEDGQIISSEYYNALTALIAEGINALGDLETDYEEYRSDLENIRDEAAAFVGAPRVASTKSAMTNHDYIYVYTGSESGMTAGNWYYWNGTEWTSGGIYNSSGFATDETLTHSGEAADAKVTGDKIKQTHDALIDYGENQNLGFLSVNDKKYLNANDEESTNNVLSHTNYIEIPENALSVTVRKKTNNGSTNYAINPDVFVYDANYNLLHAYSNVTISDLITRNLNIENAKYIRINQPGGNSSTEKFIKFNFYDSEMACNSLGDSDLSYLITHFNEYISDTGPSSSTLLCHTDYIQIPDWATKIIATNKTYNSAGTTAYPISHVFVFYDENKNYITYNGGYSVPDILEAAIPDNAKYVIVNQPLYQNQNKRFIQFSCSPIVARVGPTQSGSPLSSTSFTQMLRRLSRISKQKTIYVDAGEYDIFAEYSALGLTGQVPVDNTNTANYEPYSVIVPPNTDIIGLGKVTLKYMPTASQTYAAESKIISPLNVSGSVNIENLIVLCKNGRYALHDETRGWYAHRNARKHYKNCKFYHYENDPGLGFSSAIGCGFDYRMDFEFDNCEFGIDSAMNGVPFYMHNRSWCRDENDTQVSLAAVDSSRITVKNSIIDGNGKTRIAVSLGNAGASTGQEIRTFFDNCYIRGWVRAADELNTSAGDVPNAYNMTLLNCSKAQILVRDQNNQYTPKELNPIGNIPE